VSEGEVSGEAVKSGHYIAEEVPDVLIKHIKEFSGQENSSGEIRV
jgi:haloacetate dehalogenase